MCLPNSDPRTDNAPVEDGEDMDRERYLRLSLSAYERGLLDSTEYVRRCAAIEEATSVDELNRIVQQLPILDGVVGGGSAVSMSPEVTGNDGTYAAGLIANAGGMGMDIGQEALPPINPTSMLDPVDLARLQQTRTSTTTRGGDHRWLALLVIVVLFVVLIIFGTALLTRIHPAHPTGSRYSHPAAPSWSAPADPSPAAVS